MIQAVEDGAARPVYYESRVIHLMLDETTLHLIDAEYNLMAQNTDPVSLCKTPGDQDTRCAPQERWELPDEGG